MNGQATNDRFRLPPRTSYRIAQQKAYNLTKQTRTIVHDHRWRWRWRWRWQRENGCRASFFSSRSFLRPFRRMIECADDRDSSRWRPEQPHATKPPEVDCDGNDDLASKLRSEKEKEKRRRIAFLRNEPPRNLFAKDDRIESSSIYRVFALVALSHHRPEVSLNCFSIGDQLLSKLNLIRAIRLEKTITAFSIENSKWISIRTLNRLFFVFTFCFYKCHPSFFFCFLNA